MKSSAGVMLSAGPLYTNAVMGQGPSVAEKQNGENLRKASLTSLREDEVKVQSEGTWSRDSFSIHHDCTNQAPYTHDMNTSDALSQLSRDHKSYDLAYVLKTTGPPDDHRRPSKLSESSRYAPNPQHAFRFLRHRRKQPLQSFPSIYRPPELQDVGGLAPPVEQRSTSTGTRYLALTVETDGETHTDPPPTTDGPPVISPSVFESRISISFPESINSADPVDILWPQQEDKHYHLVHRRPVPSALEPSPLDDAVAGALDHQELPIRPSASSPPTPEPMSAVSMADSYRSELAEHPAEWSFDLARALSSHPVHATTTSSLPLPGIVASHEVLHDQEKGLEMRHPTPRRMASHPVLLQRASSLGPSLMDRRSFTAPDSPGPPPPRSPLRPRRDDDTISNVLDMYQRQDITPRSAPSIKDVNDWRDRPIQPLVVTDCTGPIKKPRAREDSPASSTMSGYQFLRRDREERTRARKLRDRPERPGTPGSSIDTIVRTAPTNIRHKLRKARPHIQIPNLRPLPLATRASSTASSNASYRKVTETALSPVSATTIEDSPPRNYEKTGYTPISATTSSGSGTINSSMALSPVMLVAEEIPVPRTKPTPKPATIVVREGKPYSPRPRSASVPRSALKRRSRHGNRTPTRPNSPAPSPQTDDAPPLPSPPPNRALPPTPPASGSEKASKTRSARIADAKKELPTLPTAAVSEHKSLLSHKRSEQLPHISSQRRNAPKEPNEPPHFQARLEALEKQNALLSAALSAVLRTNGALNSGALHATLGDVAEEARMSIPMSWESRIARRSAASHGASSSNGSALDMYMTTRGGSKHGR